MQERRNGIRIDQRRQDRRPVIRTMDFVRALLWAMALTAGAAPASAIVLAPHALFIDHHTRSGILYIQNPGDDVEEVTIELEYGYPASDSTGGVHIELIPNPPADAPSAAGWVRALPQRVRVQPGARQAVRLLAQPPAELADGEYWSRIIVTSQAAQAPVTVSEEQAVRVGLTLEMRTITSLIYRKGQVTTGVTLDNFAVESAGDTLIAAVNLSRHGNGAYLGKIEFVLTAADGAEVGGWEQVVAVYYDLFRRYSLPTSGLAPGNYRLRTRLTTERQDIAQTQLLPAPMVERTIAVVVPDRSGD
jgi:P pilus assembly chaperone PapD